MFGLTEETGYCGNETGHEYTRRNVAKPHVRDDASTGCQVDDVRT